LKINIMKNLLITIAMMGVINCAVAQETPKSTKKAKTKSDTIISHTKSSAEKKSTYKIDSTKSDPAKKSKKTVKTTKTRKDTIK
jgi:hypothetical protein